MIPLRLPPRRGIGGHTAPVQGARDEWLTPRHILDALGPFDLDPCAAPDPQVWPTAREHFTERDDGLLRPWHGFVWCNPPYGPRTWTWLDRLAAHGHGLALIFARTETDGFVHQVWRRAHGLLFLAGRLHFHHPDGTRARGNSGGPSVLVAYGAEARCRLRDSGLPGSFIDTWTAKEGRT